ncbi:MAG: DUF3800 domain-containing protein [Armatimonadetes bacterium]|nr:DUF3800 domain-containing protein [Armatimonadota bacterium]
MDLYYADESYDASPGHGNPMRFVLSAVRVREEDWEVHLGALFDWRGAAKASLGVPMESEFHATELLGNRGLNAPRPVDERTRVSLFSDGLRLLASLHEVHIINVSLKVTKRLRDINALEQAAWERLFNRINRTGQELERRALLICDEGKEQKLTRLCRHLRLENLVPSRYGKWGDTGQRKKHLPLGHLIEDPLFKSSKGSYFLQMADLVAYALLRFDNPTPKTQSSGVSRVFPSLQPVLYRPASRWDRYYGVVRR